MSDTDDKLVELSRRISELSAQQDTLDADGFTDPDDEIWDAMDEIYREMLTLRPTTLEGCRALASATVMHFHGKAIVREDGAEGLAIAFLLSWLSGVRAIRFEDLHSEDDPLVA